MASSARCTGSHDAIGSDHTRKCAMTGKNSRAVEIASPPTPDCESPPLKERGGISRLGKKAIKSIPVVGPAGTWAVRRARAFRARASKLRQLIRHLLKHPEQLRYLERAYRARGYHGFREELAIQ